MFAPGHYGLAAGLFDRITYFGRIGCHNRTASLGFHRPAPHMHDHRLTVNIGQGFAWQTVRLHTCGDHN
jgi:hypothetical protein